MPNKKELKNSIPSVVSNTASLSMPKQSIQNVTNINSLSPLPNASVLSHITKKINKNKTEITHENVIELM